MKKSLELDAGHRPIEITIDELYYMKKNGSPSIKRRDKRKSKDLHHFKRKEGVVLILKTRHKMIIFLYTFYRIKRVIP